MGARELRQTFNEMLGSAGTCTKALLEYEPGNDTQWQRLYFSGNWADGSGFTIKSNRIPPNGDVTIEARSTAERLLQERTQ